ncbi:MAG: class I SAM-dependent methyltransferase [Deltaproteobacteria bacterium]|jgi:SAM-dependent methyltransferase|nr:class I SAM-dependent methyltransferase [Deltaproteobacteria bacterium]
MVKMDTTAVRSADKDFWNRRAKSFPRYSPDPSGHEVGLLQLARGLGVDFRGKTVLDVGCGAGLYTIRLAKEGKFVTGLDVSDEVLSINSLDAQREKLDNVEYVNSDWLAFKPDRVYDLLFCSMTPALHSHGGRLKLLEFPKAQVVYVDLAAPPKNRILSELIDEGAIKPKPLKSTPELKAFLDKRDLAYRTAQKPGRWDKRLTKDEFKLSLSGFIAFWGEPTREIDLDAFAERFSDGLGQYLESTEYVSEIVVWENP